MTKELAKTLTLALVNYIDENRPEGTMDCSSAECEKLEKAFEVYNLDFVEKFMEKKLSRLTEFEKCLVEFYNKRTCLTCDKDGVYNRHELEDLLHTWSKKLLDLAKKELARLDEVITLGNIGPYDKGFKDGKAEAMADLERTYFSNPEKLPKWLKDDIARRELNAHTKGYNKGYEVATKLYEESVAYHFPNPPAINIPTWTPPCYNSGPCTNPQMDCINCPRKTTGGGFSTSSGTSTATLHGNTSATDGKEHNPSFTD